MLLLLFGVIVLVSLRVLLLLMAERLRPCLRLQTTRAHRAARHAVASGSVHAATNPTSTADTGTTGASTDASAAKTIVTVVVAARPRQVNVIVKPLQWALGAVWHSTSGHLKGRVALP